MIRTVEKSEPEAAVSTACTGLIVRHEKGLQKLLDIKESEKEGLCVNNKKKNSGYIMKEEPT